MLVFEFDAVAFGQTVLARAVRAAGFDWDAVEAHSAIYDASRTADLFCEIVNRWDRIDSCRSIQDLERLVSEIMRTAV